MKEHCISRCGPPPALVRGERGVRAHGAAAGVGVEAVRRRHHPPRADQRAAAERGQRRARQDPEIPRTCTQIFLGGSSNIFPTTGVILAHGRPRCPDAADEGVVRCTLGAVVPPAHYPLGHVAARVPGEAARVAACRDGGRRGRQQQGGGQREHREREGALNWRWSLEMVAADVISSPAWTARLHVSLSPLARDIRLL